MKIGYVANVRFPTEKAHGLQIMQMCRAFAAAGHDVTLVVPERANPIREDAWTYYGLPPTFAIVHVPSLDLIRHAARLGNLALWLSAIFYGRRARQVLRRMNLDLVYSRDPFAALWIPRGPKAVFEAHDFPRREWWYRGFWKRFDRIVALTRGLADRFVRAGVPKAKLVVAHDAVELERFRNGKGRDALRDELGLPHDAFVVAYPGQLYPHKGAGDLIAASARMGERTLVVIAGGSGEALEQARREAEASGANVLFLGHAAPARVASLLLAADLAALPNRGGNDYNARYTSPMKLFEYLAAGRAIVATDLPTVREVLDDSCAAFVPPEDPDALAAAILALKDAPEKRARLERGAAERAKTHTWSARAEAVLEGLL